MIMASPLDFDDGTSSNLSDPSNVDDQSDDEFNTSDGDSSFSDLSDREELVFSDSDSETDSEDLMDEVSKTFDKLNQILERVGYDELRELCFDPDQFSANYLAELADEIEFINSLSDMTKMDYLICNK